MSPTPLTIVPYIFDLEISGRCNTICAFCPREEMKRGEQFMSDQNFEHFIFKLKRYSKQLQNQNGILAAERAQVFLSSGTDSPLRIIMCGMGEALMHKKCAEWIGRIRREVGLRVSLVTNGLLLQEKTIEALRDNEITVILVSVPGIDRKSYERVMKIDWDQILENITAAHERLPGRVQINATIPDHSDFSESDVLQFWKNKNIPVAGINSCHNRGGFLRDHSLTGSFSPFTKFCGILARHNFIAWDGRILACCHDLHAEAVFGHIALNDFMEIAEKKTPIIPEGPQFKVCENCNDQERCHSQQVIGLSHSANQTS